MNGLFGNFIFLNPWILAGLGALPLLWFLLRVMPPAPRLISFPAARFLKDLIPENQTPDHTPWWILLLRLLIAALVLLALAQPVYNPAGQLAGTGPVRLVIDNGWAAARNWDEEIQAADEMLKRAGREKRDIYILTTAALPGTPDPASYGPLAEGQASAILKAMKPMPWPADYKHAADFIEANKPSEHLQSTWFGHGLDEGGFRRLASALKDQGSLTYFQPAPEHLPLALKLPENPGYDLQIDVVTPHEIAAGLPVTVQALAEDGRILDLQTQKVNPAKIPLTLTFAIPEALRNDVTQFRIAGNPGAGGVYTLDERFHKRSVGIVGPADEAETKPFIEDIYYLKRALEPYTTLYLGTVDEILKHEPSMIILPDTTSMPVETMNALEHWVRDGGLLLRFAGPKTASGESRNFLVPVPLRSGGRSTQGTLTWEHAPKLLPFPAQSPFFGMDTGESPITVKQQVLAEPVQDLEKKTWAALEDGTPLITAGPMDKGMLVMVHTTASPEWSDLALSGVFVEILRRLVNISGSVQSTTEQTDGLLQPLWVFDGFGVMQNAESWARAIPAAEFSTTIASAEHPPGLYGRAVYQQALNIGDHIDELNIVKEFPLGVQHQNYSAHYERDLMPFILYAALCLMLFDWLIMILMTAGLGRIARFAGVAMILFSVPAHAQENYDADSKYADGLYLAYVETGDSTIDTTSVKGLTNLSAILKYRTSAEPDGIAAVNPETDTLAFFPLIYWPVGGIHNALSDKALKNIQDYLDHGGTILFDTRDQNYAASTMTGTPNMDRLRLMIGGLNVPPLEPISKTHVLTKSFYLLDSFPGRYTGGTLWVEGDSVEGRDGVSSIIIGSNDWAGAWAQGDVQEYAFSGGTRQQEMAFRFGINVMMYALTGNYKSDQVHVPQILERLGQ